MKSRTIVLLAASHAEAQIATTRKAGSTEIHPYTPTDVKVWTLSPVKPGLRFVIGNIIYLYTPKQSEGSTLAADVSACCAVLDQLRKCSRFVVVSQKQTPDQIAAYAPVPVDDLVIEFPGVK